MAVFNAGNPISVIGGHRRPQALPGPTLFTIQQVGQACGLPGPVIMQLVPRTWVEQTGWMYTADQLRDAVVIAANMRRQRTGEPPLSRSDVGEVTVCDRCARIAPFHDEARGSWLHVVEPNGSAPAATSGQDYCPNCLIDCAPCEGPECKRCGGAGQIPRTSRVHGTVR